MDAEAKEAALHERLIRRHGFRGHENRLRDGCCPEGGTGIPGMWSLPAWNRGIAESREAV